MAKILLVIAVTVLIVFLFRKAGRRGEPLKKQQEAAKVEDMVRCQACGVNLPRSEAIMSGGRFFCCEEHRRQNGA